MTIKEYFGDWANIIDLQEADRIMKRLSASKSPVCPLKKNVFKAFRLCSLRKLRVVILGQDPYPNLRPLSCNPIATGLAFANASDTPDSRFSPSLEVLRESVIDYTRPHGILNFDPTLEKWEEQGVLLLNAALSCEAGKPGSHLLMWRPFITSFLSKLSMYSPGTVYLLMGSAAWALEPHINSHFNHVIRIRHPSFYARTHTSMPSDVWREINKILVGQSGEGIKWYEEF